MNQQRLIFALDVPNSREALALVDQLGDAVIFYKIGLELCMSGDYFTLMTELKARGKKIFADMKFFDIPQTVGQAVANLARHGADFVTVHGDPAIVRSAVNNKGAMKILAVTVLTSMSDGDLLEMGYADNVALAVKRRAMYSQAEGADGVIASGHEASMIRATCGKDFLIVTPGIRLEATSDDQKRTLNVEEALQAGADYLVMGRPIRDALNPVTTAMDIQNRIQAFMRQSAMVS